MPADAQGTYEALEAGRLGANHLQLVPSRGELTMVPATAKMPNAEAMLTESIGGETRLKRALAAMASNYDYAVLDTPPSLGLLVLNAMLAADGIVAPVRPSFLDLAGLALAHGRAAVNYAERTGAQAPESSPTSPSGSRTS